MLFRVAAPWEGRFFDADDGANGASNSTDDVNAGSEPGGDEGGAPITFPNQEAFNARMDRAVRSQLNSLAKEFGFETPDELTAAAKAAREHADAQKSELEKANETLTSLNGKISDYQAKLVSAKAEAAALAAGVPVDRVAYAVRMADLAEVVSGGEIDEAALKAAVEKVVQDIPELAAAGGNHRSSINPDGTNNQNNVQHDMNALLRRATHRAP